MSLWTWMKGHTDGEKLVAQAMLDFATGNTKAALADLLEGLQDLAGDGAAARGIAEVRQMLRGFFGGDGNQFSSAHGECRHRADDDGLVAWTLVHATAAVRRRLAARDDATGS